MFRATAKPPSGVDIIPLFDIREIDGGTLDSAGLSMFTPGPVVVDTDNNYVNNPLPGKMNHVLFGISIEPTMQIIEDDSTNSIDAVKAANFLKDATLKIYTNGGRDRKLLVPLKEFMNFASTKVEATGDATNGVVNLVTFESTGPRRLENLFYFGPNESWQFVVLFKNTGFPTTANWTAHGAGRFGLNATIFVGEMNDHQLAEYDQRLKHVANM